MGMHKIEITMVGGHGCDRTAKEGEPLVNRCGNIDTCPDCAAQALVDKFKSTLNYSGCGATFTHWPGEPCEVVDDLVTGTRKKGQF